LVFAIAVLLFVLLLATVLVFAMRELSHRRADAADASTIKCLSEDLTPIERQVLYALPRDTRLRLFVGRYTCPILRASLQIMAEHENEERGALYARMRPSM